MKRKPSVLDPSTAEMLALLDPHKGLVVRYYWADLSPDGGESELGMVRARIVSHSCLNSGYMFVSLVR